MNIKVIISILCMVIFLVAGCSSNEKNIYGTWKSGEILPMDGGDPSFTYYPTATIFTISEKFIKFFEFKPLEYKSENSGDTVELTILKKSIFEKEAMFERMLSIGSLKEEQLESLQKISCKLMDDTTMECDFAEYWTASTSKVPSSLGKPRLSQNTYSPNRYKHTKVLFTRIQQSEKPGA